MTKNNSYNNSDINIIETVVLLAMLSVPVVGAMDFFYKAYKYYNRPSETNNKLINEASKIIPIGSNIPVEHQEQTNDQDLLNVRETLDSINSGFNNI